MVEDTLRSFRGFPFVACLAIAAGLMFAAPSAGSAQLSGTENGQWQYLGGDAGHTRYSTVSQINAANFEDLEVAWEWPLRVTSTLVPKWFSRST